MRRVLGLMCLVVLLGPVFARAQGEPMKLVAPGVWFLLGERGKGYSNTVVIEMKDYLIVVDANYPGRAKELLVEIPKLSRKPVKWVFDTHAHGDHSYGNSVWTAAGARTLAYVGVADEMKLYEPARWQAAEAKREDVRDLHEANVQPPMQTFSGDRFVLKDETREVEFLHLGWGHTRGDGYVWLPKEHILCTGDAAVNGPRNKLWDADVANWPKVLDKALALGPVVVLPGHGDAGGPEILSGQASFLRDLYDAVQAEMKRSVSATELSVKLPERDANWIPPDLSQDAGIVASEIKAGKAAGSLPHVWQ
jgi:cyclase